MSFFVSTYPRICYINKFLKHILNFGPYKAIEFNPLINIDNNLPAIASHIRLELMSKAGETGGIVGIVLLSA